MVSAGFAPWGGAGGEELVDPLVGDAQDESGVAHADPAPGERGSGLSGLLDGQAVGVTCLFSGGSGGFDGPAGGLGQHRDGGEVDLVFVGVEPQGGGFAHAGQGLIDGLSPGVDSGFLFELDGPAPVFFPLQAGRVGLHVFGPLAIGVVSHLVPRQGSRSRSIDLSVPVGMSPVWRGITVWQLAHRQI
jgi:hypothetical protein